MSAQSGFNLHVTRLIFLLLPLWLSGCLGQPAPTPTMTAGSGPGEAVIEASPFPTQAPGGLGATQAAPPAASPAPLPEDEPFHGIEIHGMADVEPAERAGAYWIRRNGLVWSRIEAEEGQRDWGAAASLEAEMQSAAEAGLQLILIIRGTPTWAQNIPGTECGPIRPDKLAAFADFVAEAVARYSAPPYNVKYWELGNEPDVDYALVTPEAPYGCWGEGSDEFYGGGYYAEMLQQVYPAIKSADSEAQVLVGGLLLDCNPVNPPETQPGSGQFRECTSSRYLEGVLENGGGAYLDGVSFHAYDYYFDSLGRYGNQGWHSSWGTTGPVATAKVEYLQDLLARYGYEDKFLMNTESALICGRSGTEPVCLEEDFAITKANYVAQSYAAAHAIGLRANLWYSIRGWRGSQLVDADRQPVLAYQAYQVSAAKLDGAVYVGQLTEFPDLMGYEFQRNGTRIWVIWALDEETHNLSLSEAPDAIFDTLGSPLPVGQELAVTLAPIYVEWGSE